VLPSTHSNTLLNLNNLVLPAAIIQTLKAGWNEHIPLTSLTNQACCKATLAAMHTLESGFTLGSDGRLVVKSLLLDFSKEDLIEMIEWFKASHHLVMAMAKHLFAQGDTAPGSLAAKTITKTFKQHFSTI
jgi:hypothetical protein